MIPLKFTITSHSGSPLSFTEAWVCTSISLSMELLQIQNLAQNQISALAPLGYIGTIFFNSDLG